MPNEILIQDVDGSNLLQLRFFTVIGFSPADAATNWTIGATPTNVAMSFEIANTNGYQSIKVDLGAVRARKYACFGTVNFPIGSHVSGEVVEYYWAPSTSTTGGSGNVAGSSGSDSSCPGGALGSITLDEFLTMCQLIGTLVIHDGVSVQNGYVGMFSPASRYGQLIVVNRSGDDMVATSTEGHCVLNPQVPELQ